MLDLRAQQRELDRPIQAAIRRVLGHQKFILGPEVADFEKAMAKRTGVHSVSCASGSDALLLSLMALDLKAGDEVITSPYTFFASVSCITRLGLRPVFVDVDPKTFQMRVDQIESRLTSRTRVLLPVHLFGLCTPMDPLMEIANARKLAIVEDAAQAIDARDHGRAAGTLGDFGCLSFFPAKNLGCDGDGGMMLTRSEEMAAKLKSLRAHGAASEYHHKWVGLNSRLDTLQAAILLAKLPKLIAWTKARRANAARYAKLFEKARLLDRITLPVEPAGFEHVYNQFVIQVAARDRERLREHLGKRGIGCKVYYPIPLHLQECFSFLGHRKGDFPNAEKLSETSLALPIYPHLSAAQQARVVEAIADFF
ncbi:MAG: DegT/DnrJ/EryC1/StrS family aminotransferase [Verrucomicrobiae bacterium]|nr:DegT/DnrJ/EryC1/StrS family aminotransferase [Verrucomicrobiae bacterium]